MDYKEHTSSVGPKKPKKLTREDFKKDVEEAVRRGQKKPKKPKKVKQVGKKAGALYTLSVAELHKMLNGKKRNLLVKSGFPDGKLPRSKVAMIALCKKLKRKRW